MSGNAHRRIVVKLGSNVLSGGSKRIDRARLVEIVRQVAELHRQDHEVVVVTSGAQLAGREVMGYPKLTANVPFKQMLAAVGQGRLMHLYEQFFDIYGLRVAQILLTAGDFRGRQSFLNARDTMLGLLQTRVVPIINENDTVATEEIKVGDNDNLAAMVVTLIDADLCILLSDIDGLYTSDPRHNPDAQLIKEVVEIDATICAAAGISTSGVGTGGMRTKIEAGRLVQRAGATMVIADGGAHDVLLRIAAGEQVGTRFLPGARAHHALPGGLESRKRWILASSRARGRLYVDAGAAAAISSGKSLLPAGVVGLAEAFQRGETVRIFHGNDEIARGVVRYASGELEQIKGQHSSQIRRLLGYDYGDEIVHHNDMVMLAQTPGADRGGNARE